MDYERNYIQGVDIQGLSAGDLKEENIPSLNGSFAILQKPLSALCRKVNTQTFQNAGFRMVRNLAPVICCSCSVCERTPGKSSLD